MSTRPSSPGSGDAPEVLEVDHEAPKPEHVDKIVDILKRGGIVATRTDTIYGLLASVNRPDALQRLAQLKVRPSGKPFVLLACDWIGVRSVTSHLPPVARVLGARYWPGPMTLVLPAEESLPETVKATGPTVALRVPSDRLLLDVLGDMRCPIAAPSANRADQPPANSAAELLATFDGEIDLVLDDGMPSTQAASTIIDCSLRTAEILRVGPIVPDPGELSPL